MATRTKAARHSCNYDAPKTSTRKDGTSLADFYGFIMGLMTVVTFGICLIHWVVTG